MLSQSSTSTVMGLSLVLILNSPTTPPTRNSMDYIFQEAEIWHASSNGPNKMKYEVTKVYFNPIPPLPHPKWYDFLGQQLEKSKLFQRAGNGEKALLAILDLSLVQLSPSLFSYLNCSPLYP